MPRERQTGQLDRDDFLARYAFSLKDLKKSKLEWSVLESIYKKYRCTISDLESTGGYVSARLRQVPKVHSLKLRVKNPERLIAKIIRKRLENPEFQIGCDDYDKRITDLIGIRALHLFKDEWRPIHDFVVETWDLHEQPIAYIREGDPHALCTAFTEAKCNVEKHPFGYRSIHYLLKTQPARCMHLVELQVRTVFEEGWSEIDHTVRYPRLSPDPRLTQSLRIFNLLAGSADEMGTLIRVLGRFIAEQETELAERDRKIAEKEKELKKTISQLKISSAEKEELKEQLAAFRQSSQLGDRLSILSPNLRALDAASPVLNYATNVWGRVLSLQKTCVVCGREYTDDALSVSFDNRCPDCRNKVTLSTEKTCAVCGRKYVDDGMSVMSNNRCPDCRDRFLTAS